MHSPKTTDFAVKLSAFKAGEGGEATGLTSEPMQGMSITLRKSTILITGSLRQKIHRESRTTFLFHVLS